MVGYGAGAIELFCLLQKAVLAAHVQLGEVLGDDGVAGGGVDFEDYKGAGFGDDVVGRNWEGGGVEKSIAGWLRLKFASSGIFEGRLDSRCSWLGWRYWTFTAEGQGLYCC